MDEELLSCNAFGCPWIVSFQQPGSSGLDLGVVRGRHIHRLQSLQRSSSSSSSSSSSDSDSDSESLWEDPGDLVF